MANITKSTYTPPAPEANAPSTPAGTSPHQSRLTLIFAVLTIIFFPLLVLFRYPFPLYPLMSWQDAIDLLTALVLVPVYWLMFKAITRGEKEEAGNRIFLVLAALWAMGHGIHLAANSINNLIGNLAKAGGVNIGGTDIYTLTYFYDEILSHYLWHLAMLGLGVLLLYFAWNRPAGEKTGWGFVAPAAVLYGITFFTITVEGLTTPMSLPITALAGLVPLIWGRKKLQNQPILAFFTISFLITFVLVAAWSLINGQFPPPELLK